MVNNTTFKHSRRKGAHSRKKLHLPSERIRAREAHPVEYGPTRKLEFRAHPYRRRNRRRRSNYRILVVLALTLVLGLLMVRLLLSFLSTSCKAFASQQFGQPQKAIVLPSPFQTNPATTAPVVALAHAIIGQESSAEFQSLNPHSGALGLAQIMPANLSEWSQEILGYRLTPDEFLNSPQLQMKIIEYKLSEYWQEALVDSSGDEETAVLRVASYWYSGSPDLYTSTVAQSYKGTDGQVHRYPSVAKYSNSILQKYRRYREGET